ncbi:MAG: MoaD/ThiS family protein [Candidatus Microthrix subdominans]|jgi:molybdopterin synthase sulfur carrier subunit|uniref:Molybdopterin synthase sulfur carrier subunit n=1 Tax=Candidatus Neomicrothrix subdominans TaxID=2954438 RepID=A0A936NCN6_9ACTN|nr:MoaD/ThiS family protein [Candidatus Microthrix sp.]MBK9297234.1 MoaD/ThiS family protein [Candidatus Microthrix subdominans]MBK6309228.1 MoaD/ThiS family protein [Candidatus Microthrix sp.]MBK6440278.1 MoaD/ThiS family protein [Candidatus Microthrix sp.]MBK6970346.1 MoaD/ThiS family protein [Candidatus Microthrix sp.]MBK7163820.1 MoaD/ThiS family protein [Candidatus Microthrix sp.]
MAVLRLFAQAREAAGTPSMELTGASVGDVLDAASRQLGPAFDEVLASSKLWLNGEPTDRNATVSDADEVAVLPPISGGDA